MVKKRKHYAIDKLPVEVRATVDEMIKADFTYKEISEFIRSTGHDISVSAIQRYSSNLMQSLLALRMSQENFSAIMQEMETYSGVDFTEPLVRLLCAQLLTHINKLSEADIAPEEVIKQTIALIRAVTYKKTSDFERADVVKQVEKEFDNLIFEAMNVTRPELYDEVKRFIQSGKSEPDDED